MNKRTIVGALTVFMFLLIAVQSVTAKQPSARVLLREGNEYFGQGNWAKAIESYESIIRLYPKSREANETKEKLVSPEIRSHKDARENYEKNVAPYFKENQSQTTTTIPIQSVPKEVLSTTTTENADGSTTTTTKYADGSTTTTTKKTLGTITVEKGKFPDGFIGTWERDNFINTLTFTTNTIKSSSQNYSWNLNVVSGDSYTWYPDENPLLKQTVTIKLVNGNLVISGDSGTGDNNWNGTWKKIK